MFDELLSEGDALKTVKDPREYRYMRILRFTLRLMGAWPGRQLGEPYSKYQTAPGYFLLFVKIASVYLSFLYLKLHSSTLPFLEIGHNYITFFMTFVTLSRLSTLSLNRKYHQIIKRFVQEMHLHYFKDESEFAMETHIQVHKISYFFAIYLNILLVWGLTMFNLLPIYKNYQNGKFDTKNKNNITFELSVYYELPFDTATNINGYIVITVFNWYASYVCANAFCMFDLMLFVLVFHIRGHFKILIHKLNSFPLPSTYNDTQNTELYSSVEMMGVEKRLKECIDYHRMLLGFTNKISGVFGPMLFVYYMFHQISGCLLLLEISQMSATAFIRYGPLTITVFQQLIQLAFVIESIGTVTGQIKDAVYSVPWEFMDTKNRKTVLIFLKNVDEPVHVNALGLAKVGVTSMALILKTSFSYFAFLRSVSE